MDTEEQKVESHIVLGYRCNHHCRHCVVQIKRERLAQDISDLTDTEAISEIDRSIQNGATKIVLTGGEPTIRKDIALLVKHCIENHCDVQIQTNGSFPNRIKEICNENKDDVRSIEFMIPIHSTNDKLNDDICQCQDGLKNAKQSLEYLYENGITIIGKIVLTKYTDDLVSICRLFEGYGAKSVIIAYPHCVSFPLDKIREVDLRREDTIKIFNGLYKEQFKMPLILQAFPRCFVGPHDEAIIQEEQKEFLELKIIENQFKASDGLQWHKYRKLDKLKFIECSDCTDNDKCEGIWKDYIKVYGNRK